MSRPPQGPPRRRTVRGDLAADVRAHGEHDVSTLRLVKLIAVNPGLLAQALLRVQQALHRRPATRRLALAVRALNHLATGADFYPGCQIGPGLLIAHPNGIVVGRGAVVGDGAFLCQRITLGQRLGEGRPERYPVLGDGVLVGAGATVLGDVRVGAGARIGAGAVVLSDVPAGATVAGNPARIVRAAGAPPPGGDRSGADPVTAGPSR